MSLVAEAVADLSEDHSLEAVDIAKTQSGRRCRLESGVETAFVAVFCNYIWQHLATSGAEPAFHEFFYSPSRRAEKKVGYDLSIGHFGSEHRIRTMHKLVYHRWCDEKWRWSVSAALDENGQPYRTHGHVSTMLQTYERHRTLEPYLVLHVCHCIHDYRRMGAICEGYRIPSLDSLLRTVIIPLHAVSGQIPGWQDIAESPDFKLMVRKAAPERLDGEPPRDYLARIAAKDQFEITVEPGNIPLSDCILTLDELCARIRQGFEPGSVDRT